MQASCLKPGQANDETFPLHEEVGGPCQPNTSVENASVKNDLNEDVKIPQFKLKKFNFCTPTVASENKEKSNLKQRLPDFHRGHKTLVTNKKFLETSILPGKSKARYMRSRKIPYSNDRTTITKLPDITKFKRSKSLVYPMSSDAERTRELERFSGFKAQSESGYKIKINKTISQQTIEERESTTEKKVPEHPVSRRWSAEDLRQSDDSVTIEKCSVAEDTCQESNTVFSQVHSNLSKRRPIEKFQKIVRLLCFLLKVKTSIDRKYKQEQYTGVFEQLDELTETVVNADGMVFDPNYFKAVKEIKLSQDAVQILSMVPGTRTEEQLQAALAGLKASVAAFGEYPLKMQRRLVTVGWYESFEAKRVIIRQGHRAENFYFILSGTALVTLLMNDSSTGEERSTTVAVLGKGCSFGELALLHHKTRSATVLCRNEVSLLAVGREDFRDIFMSYEDGKEPEHVQFLRSIPCLKDLPLDQCSTRPDICIFHYFRRGVVIVKNSKTEWIYIIKSGSCRVLTSLVKRKASLQTCKSNRDIYSHPAIPVDEHERRRLLYTASGDRMHYRCNNFPETKRPRTEPNTRSLALPVIPTAGENKFIKTAKKVNFALPWLSERLNRDDRAQAEVEAHREKIQTLHRKLTSVGSNKTTAPFNNKIDNTEKAEHICVQIELIKPKDQFGLASLLYDNEAVKCHLVSNGAECILIKKSWFLQNADESFLRDLRGQVPPYPTQERLEQKFQDQANWESFKSQTINDLLDTLQL